MTTNEVKTLAEEFGYKYVETTTSMTGYPSNVRAAITGFANFDEAQDFADKQDMALVRLIRRDGWNMWYDENNRVFDIPELEPDDINAQYSLYSSTDEDELIEILHNEIDGLEDIESIKKVVDMFAKIKDAIAQLDDNEAIYVFMENCRFEIRNRYSSEWTYDSKHYIIAAIPYTYESEDDNENEEED